MKTGYFNSILSSQGVPILATITVYLPGTSTKATIYANVEGSVTKDNPFQTDSYGRFQFFATAGYYDIEISGTGITTYKIEDIFIGFPYQFLDAVCNDGDVVTSDGEIVYDRDF